MYATLLNLFVLMFCFSCTKKSEPQKGQTPPRQIKATSEELAPYQQAALHHIFYAGNHLPQTPTAEEVSALAAKKSALPEMERKVLTALYGHRDDFWIYALRDTDRDGIPDFTVNEYDGRLTDGDLDLDGDGILNAADCAPYTSTVGGVDTTGDLLPDRNYDRRDSKGIPLCIDWAQKAQKSEKLVQLQHQFYLEYKIVVVDRSSEWTEEALQAAYDALSVLFQKVFPRGQVIPTLRTMAAERHPELMGTDPMSAEYAYVNAEPANLSVFEKALKRLSPAFLLSLFAHEIAHVYQFNLDIEEIRGTSWSHGATTATKFNALLKTIGWEMTDTPLSEEQKWSSIMPLYPEASLYAYTFGGKTAEEWAALVEQISSENKDPFKHEELIRHSVISFYSLSSPYEWHGDNMIAYLNLNLQSAAGVDAERREKINEENLLEWKTDFTNAQGAQWLKHYNETFPVTQAQWVELSKRYL